MIAKVHRSFREYSTDNGKFNQYLIIEAVEHKDQPNSLKAERVIARSEQIIRKYIQDKYGNKVDWKWKDNIYGPEKGKKFVTYRTLNDRIAETVLVD